MEKEKIGTDAGNIWQILNEKGNVKIVDLKKTTKMDIKDIYLALGWLARENKIQFFEMEKELAVCIIS
jgi:hypothetical protein